MDTEAARFWFPNSVFTVPNFIFTGQHDSVANSLRGLVKGDDFSRTDITLAAVQPPDRSSGLTNPRAPYAGAPGSFAGSASRSSSSISKAYRR